MFKPTPKTIINTKAVQKTGKDTPTRATNVAEKSIFEPRHTAAETPSGIEPRIANKRPSRPRSTVAGILEASTFRILSPYAIDFKFPVNVWDMNLKYWVGIGLFKPKSFLID